MSNKEKLNIKEYQKKIIKKIIEKKEKGHKVILIEMQS